MQIIDPCIGLEMGLLDRKDPSPRPLGFVCGNVLKFASQLMCKVTGY